MRKKILEKRLQRLNAKKATLMTRALESQDAAEVRNINAELSELNDEIAEVQEELDAIAEEERQAQAQAEIRQTPPAGAQLVNGCAVAASFALSLCNLFSSIFFRIA